MLYKIFEFKKKNEIFWFCCDTLFNFYFTVAFGSLCSSNADCQHHYHAPPDGEVYCHNIYSHIGRCQLRTSKYTSPIFFFPKNPIYIFKFKWIAAYVKRKKNSPDYHNCLFFWVTFTYSTLEAMESLGSL